MKRFVKLQKPLLFLLAALLAGVMAWYYDVYVNWDPKLFPLAVAASVLVFFALALTSFLSGKAKPIYKWLGTAAALVVFLSAQQGLSYWIHNVKKVDAAGTMRAVLPVLALLAALLLVKPFLALSRKGKWAAGSAMVVLLCAGTAAWAVTSAKKADIPLQDYIQNKVTGMSTVEIDFSEVTGKIKPMHAVNGPPENLSDDNGLFTKLREANAPYVRLHDSGGPFGGSRYVDIANIFPDFDADETDPASYDFAFTDAMIANMERFGLRAFYRLGCTIENNHRIKAYNIFPPADPEKWARICEHIILHYNEGWADGYRYGIEYWEIWNEPDGYSDPLNNPMWRGTPEQYYELYDVTAKHLKGRFPDIKVGGYAATNFKGIFDPEETWAETDNGYRMEFFHGFMRYISERNSPLDFFSWHTYETADKAKAYAAFVREQLDAYGYGDAESILNEWNPQGQANKGTMLDAAQAAAMMCVMQKSPIDMCMYYRAYVSSDYCGLFSYDNRGEVFKAYYAFRAFGALYALGGEVRSGTNDGDIYVCAATGEDRRAALVVNTSNKQKKVVFDGPGDISKCWATDEEHDYENIKITTDKNGMVTLPPYAMWLIEFK